MLYYLDIYVYVGLDNDDVDEYSYLVDICWFWSGKETVRILNWTQVPCSGYWKVLEYIMKWMDIEVKS